MQMLTTRMQSFKLPEGSTLCGVVFEAGQWIIRWAEPGESMPGDTLSLNDNGRLSCGPCSCDFCDRPLALLELLIPTGEWDSSSRAIFAANIIDEIDDPDSEQDDDGMQSLRNLKEYINKRLLKNGFPVMIRMTRGEEKQLFIDYR